MLLQLINVLYVLVAIAMIGLILMQRGAGAQAGSGFGGGASATVFGSRGASNFLTKSTKWLAIVFFTISMGMAVYASKSARQGGAEPAAADLGVMGQAAPAAPARQVPSAQVPSAQVPAAPAQAPAAPLAAPDYTQPPASAPEPAPAPAPAPGS
ncbi:preprotein translocase subunit SecG [Thermomonas sp.]|uniref:preprotein translocase subunit SecG n=1 Tax=Thermomonas sp. TaxID=1971895 RepID=UPI001EC52C83|nr:preprotein translocase subunit SecG [Thermomonas sp.]MBK6417143.1 preprotein translocase subunit SecG [Thermomonas sp.]